MKLTVTITTDPQSFDLEDAIHNELPGDGGLRDALEFEIGQIIEEWMEWGDTSVRVKVKEE